MKIRFTVYTLQDTLLVVPVKPLTHEVTEVTSQFVPDNITI